MRSHLTVSGALWAFVILQVVVSVNAAVERTCHSGLGYHPPDKFGLFSCAWCYQFLFSLKPGREHAASDQVPYLYSKSKNKLITPDINNRTSVNEICSTLNSDECYRWKSCCVAANNCCERQLSTPVGNINETCGRTWDGWGCWDDTEPDQQVYLSCPLFLHFADPSREAIKVCHKNGSWERKLGKEWTNYQPCLNMEDLKTSIFIGLGCSIACIILLCPSIFIFLRYQNLRKQHRIRLHINFFLSLLLKEITVVLWDMCVTYERITNTNSSTSVLIQNGAGCKILSFLKIYFKNASFTWMFCEGFFLHRLMSDAFSPPRSLLPFYVAGWTVPFATTLVYAIIRAVYANESCWSSSYNNTEWIFDSLNLGCIVVNLVFLCNILRILLTQMQSHPNEPSNFRKAVKATFVLIPLFGVQFFVTIYRIPVSAPGGLEYERFSIIVNNLQGFFVALMYCFINNEVITHLRRTWRRRVRDRSFSHSRSKFNSTSINMTFISRTEGDFQSTHKSLNKHDGGSEENNTERNGGGHISKEGDKALLSDQNEEGSHNNSTERDPLNA